MIIKHLTVGECKTNCYIISDETGGNAAIIDPGDNAGEIMKVVKENSFSVKYIIITHGHTDHVLAAADVQAMTGAPVVINGIDAWRLPDEELINSRPYVKEPYKPVKADILISDGSELKLGAITLRFIGIPGHTPGSTGVIAEDVLFTGDTLLKGGHGKIGLPGSDLNMLIRSFRKLYMLEGDYRILPGHREETTLEKERKENIYMLQSMQ